MESAGTTQKKRLEWLSQLCQSLRLGHIVDRYDRIPLESKEQFLIDVLSAEKEEREASKIEIA